MDLPLAIVVPLYDVIYSDLVEQPFSTGTMAGCLAVGFTSSALFNGSVISIHLQITPLCYVVRRHLQLGILLVLLQGSLCAMGLTGLQTCTY